MFISRLALDHFRSWDHCLLDFTPGVTILQGANGLGKTNIVEAIEFLSTGASHRTSSSAPLVERGFDMAAIRANVTDEDAARTTTYEVTIRVKGANRARVNGGPSLYLRDIVGDIPLVAFTPDDQRLVSADPAARRQFLNQTASLLVRGYADTLQRFTHVAKQRATLLKQLGAADDFDASRDAALSGLEIWTGQYIDLGLQLTRNRMAVVDRLRAPFHELVHELAGAGNDAELDYEPSFDEILQGEDAPRLISEHFQRLYAGEVARGRNLIGPQRDDMPIGLNGFPAREFASNGEMWTLGLALKMAVCRLLEERFGTQPIVILDDVFAQLDETRRAQILRFAAAQRQVFITVAAASDIPDDERLADSHVVDVAALRARNDDGEDL
ncbi:MAG: DNA replication and repair protein RecF [Bifidobacterium choerinum]